MGTNCDPLIADLLLYFYEREFMSSLHKYKEYNLVDMLIMPYDILMIFLPSRWPWVWETYSWYILVKTSNRTLYMHEYNGV